MCEGNNTMRDSTVRDADPETSMARGHRRPIGLCGLLGCFVFGIACALSLSDLSNQDAARGIKGALDQGATVAVAKLGVPGGFLNNPKVKIPLPPALDEVAKGMRMIGRGRDADELVAAMNSAAEKAVPGAKELLINAVKTMSLTDAKQILTGGDGSVTQFFRAKTAAPLTVKFLPIVKRETERVGLGAEVRPVRRGGAEARADQGRCRQRRGICNPQGSRRPVPHDLGGGACDQTKSGGRGERDRHEGVCRVALSCAARRQDAGLLGR